MYVHNILYTKQLDSDFKPTKPFGYSNITQFYPRKLPVHSRMAPLWLSHNVGGSDLITKRKFLVFYVSSYSERFKNNEVFFGIQKSSNSRNLHKLPVHSGVAPSWLET